VNIALANQAGAAPMRKRLFKRAFSTGVSRDAVQAGPPPRFADIDAAAQAAESAWSRQDRSAFVRAARVLRQAGALSPAEGLRVITVRSALMARLAGRGAMALLELDATATDELIAGYPGVSVAVHASPRQTVIAGPPGHVDALIAVVAGQDRLARRIEVDVASHHPTVDVILPELRAALADLTPAPPAIPVFSTVFAGQTPAFDADYWVANLRSPVRFSEAVAAAGAGHATFVEVSSHPLLTHAITETLGDAHHHAIPTLIRDTPDTLAFYTNLNTTHTTHPPATEHPPEPHPQLPTTPWHHTHHWITTSKRPSSASAPKIGTLLGERFAVSSQPVIHVWRARLAPHAKPYPGYHRLHGLEVVPVSVLLQTLLTAAGELGVSLYWGRPVDSCHSRPFWTNKGRLEGAADTGPCSYSFLAGVVRSSSGEALGEPASPPSRGLERCSELAI